ncbi:MAG TPA: hypothetical protein VE288_09860 [Rubrobacteraceae bacterium]|nr:hypothetical protein [Rubrobacteraceae bacterium]
MDELEQSLADLFDSLIVAWVDREFARKQWEEMQREEPPTPPPQHQQPVDDLRVVARYVQARDTYDGNLAFTEDQKERAETAYEALVGRTKEFIPEPISVIHTYRGPGNPDLRGKNHIIDILPDSISVRPQEQ